MSRPGPRARAQVAQTDSPPLRRATRDASRSLARACRTALAANAILPSPAEERDALYDQLNRRTLWFRGRGGEETGHTALYRPMRTIARTRPSDPARAGAVEELFSSTRTLFPDLASQPTILPAADEDLEAALARFRQENPSIDALLFEGFGINPALEGAETCRALASWGRDAGLIVWNSDPDAVSTWNNKVAFRERAASILGPASIPPGMQFDREEEVAIRTAIQELFADGASQVIVKQNGAGGGGNCILSSVDELSKLAPFLATPMDASATWVSVESWVPWTASLCNSSFLTDTSVTPVGLCQQLLSAQSAGFLGSRSFLDLEPRDTQAVVRTLLPLFEAMRIDGIRGFAAVDVIVSPPSDAPQELRLPSGSALRVIETNARVNGHNQELLAASLVAQREGLSVDDIVHLRTTNPPIAGSTSVAQSVEAIRVALEGLAVPLTLAPLGETDVQFIVDSNDGSAPSHYDGVLLLARRAADAPERLRAALTRLRSLGIAST